MEGGRTVAQQHRTFVSNRQLPNKALHQTGRGGVALFLRRGPVIEARPAGEGRCWTDHVGYSRLRDVDRSPRGPSA
jgi:hypothetical protein